MRHGCCSCYHDSYWTTVPVHLDWVTVVVVAVVCTALDQVDCTIIYHVMIRIWESWSLFHRSVQKSSMFVVLDVTIYGDHYHRSRWFYTQLVGSNNERDISHHNREISTSVGLV